MNFILWKNTNLINLIGIHIYLYIYYHLNSLIALLVYINGIICHSSITYKNFHFYFRYYDILVNIFLVIYVNYYTMYQYDTLQITFFVLLSWIFKKLLTEEHSFNNQIIHVNCIHYPLAFCLVKFIKFI